MLNCMNRHDSKKTELLLLLLKKGIRLWSYAFSNNQKIIMLRFLRLLLQPRELFSLLQQPHLHRRVCSGSQSKYP